VDKQDKRDRFEAAVMPHLDAAYNLARWLARDEHDAQDIVQEAFLRAFKFFDGFHGENSRSWLLSIVRNATFTWLQKNRKSEILTVFDEETHRLDEESADTRDSIQQADHLLVRQAMENLPAEFREVMILRELEGLSYKEIAEIIGTPVGTVMSRLARGRKQLLGALAASLKQEGTL
jgi:RNA polymerase sigma-70 factor (ECF subfamily)